MRIDVHSRLEHLPPYSVAEPHHSRGFELVLALIVVCLGGFFAFAAIEAGVFSVPPARHSRARGMLDTTLDHLSLRSYDQVASMQGGVRRLAGTPDDQRYGIDLAVSQARLGLLQIQAVLVDRREGREVDRVVTYRSRPGTVH